MNLDLLPNNEKPYNNNSLTRWGCSSQPPVGSPNNTSSTGPPDFLPPSFIPWKDRAKAMGNTKIPKKGLINVDSFKSCALKYTYIWLDNRIGFWSKPVLIDTDHVLLWIWDNSNWSYFKVMLKYINTYMCY